MERELEVKITGTNAGWKAVVADSQRRAKGLADEQITQAKRAASEQFIALGKLQLAGVKLGEKLRDEAKKTADTQAKEAKRGADAQFVALGSLQVAGVKLGDQLRAQAKRTADAQIREQKRAVDAQVRDQKRAADEAAREAKRIDNAMRGVGSTGRASMLEIAGGVAAAVGGMNILRQAAEGVQQAIRDAAVASRELAAGAVGQRDKQRELAATLGVKNDNKFLGQNAQFGVDTAMSPAETLGFRMQLAGSGIQFRGKNISESEYSQYEKSVGALGIARGVDASTVGDFAGGVLGLKDFSVYGQNASEEATATANRQLAILAEGRGELSVMAYQQAKVNAALVNEDALRGSVQSPEEAATLVSVAAEKSPRDAAETVRATLRGLQDYTDKDAGPLLARAGIKSGQSPIEKLRLLAPVVEGDAKEKGINVPEYLRSVFKDELTAEGVGVMLNRGISGGLFDKRAAISANLAGTAPAQSMIDEFMGSDVGQARVADAKVSRAETLRGAENSRLDTLRKQTLAGLILHKQIDTSGTNLVDFLQGKIPFSQIEESKQQRINTYSRFTLNARAQEAGVAGVDQGFMGLGHNTSEGMNDAMNAVMERIDAKGGNPLNPTKTEELLEKNNVLMQKLVDQGQGGRGQVPAPAVNVGPAPVNRRP